MKLRSQHLPTQHRSRRSETCPAQHSKAGVNDRMKRLNSQGSQEENVVSILYHTIKTKVYTTQPTT